MPVLLTRGFGPGSTPGRLILRGLVPSAPAGPTAPASLLTRGYGTGSTPGRVLLRGLVTGGGTLTATFVPGTRLDRLNAAVAQQLLDWGLGTPATIRFYAAEPADPMPGGGDPQFCLWPGAQRLAWERGGGRFNTGVDGLLKLKVWSQQQRDPAQREDLSLNDPERGVLALAHGVMEALHNFFPVDTTGAAPVYLTARTLCWLSTGEAQRHRKNPQWIGVTLTFSLTWRAGLDVERMV